MSLSSKFFKQYQKLFYFLLISLPCLIGILCTYHTSIQTGFQQTLSDPGDTRFINYILEHEFRWLIGDPMHSSLWDPPFFYPKKNALAYSETFLTTAPIYWLLRAFQIVPDTAYQIWTIALFVINYVVAYLIFRRFQFSAFSSSAASYLFTFANMRTVQIGHSQLLPQFFSLFCLYAIYRAFTAKRTKEGNLWIGWFGASFVAQLYAGFYLGWFFTLGLCVATAVALVNPAYRKPLFHFLTKYFKALSLTLTLCLLALAPLGYHYWLASSDIGLRSLIDVTLPRIHSWFYLGAENFMYGFLSQWTPIQRMPWENEQKAGLGLITMTLVILGLRKSQKIPLARIFWLTAIVLILGSLYTGRIFFWHNLWEVVYYTFPAAKAIRVTSRICFLILIPACFGLAYFFEHSKISKTLCLAFFGLIMLEQMNDLPSYDKIQMRQDVQSIAQRVPASCPVFFYSPVEKNEPQWKLHFDTMWASLEAHRPTVNGHSGGAPRGWNLWEINSATSVEQIAPRLNNWLSLQNTSLDPQCWVKGMKF